MIQISMIPQEVLYKYSLKYKSHNGYIFSRVTKGVYGISQEGQIAHSALVRHLEPYGYHPSSNNPGLWTHTSRSINLTLDVNNFGVKYSVKDCSLHLKASLEDKYKVTTDLKIKFTLV